MCIAPSELAFVSMRPSREKAAALMDKASGNAPNQEVILGLTISAIPIREKSPRSSRRSVTLYPESPLLDSSDSGGFEVLDQLGRDLDTFLQFEAEEGHQLLLRLFCHYCHQFGQRSTMRVSLSNLPAVFTDFEQFAADLGVLVLDATFAPGAAFAADTRKIFEQLAADHHVPAEYIDLANLIKDFRRVCLSPACESLLPLDEDLKTLAGSQAVSTDDLFHGSPFRTLTNFVKRLGQARTALNRIAQHLQKRYLALRDDAKKDFGPRTRYMLLGQIVLHLHRRLPMAEGRTDLGNLCGLVMELVKHWHQGQDNLIRAKVGLTGVQPKIFDLDVHILLGLDNQWAKELTAAGKLTTPG
jgi:hypothetical protein